MALPGSFKLQKRLAMEVLQCGRDKVFEVPRLLLLLTSFAGGSEPVSNEGACHR
jgi:hypothetical protein